MITKLYPNGKTKAFNVTYDDGVLQDIRFVALINKYNIKGTFNLNKEKQHKYYLKLSEIVAEDKNNENTHCR